MKRTSMYTAVLALSLAMALAGGGLACRTFRERLDALEEQAAMVLLSLPNVLAIAALVEPWEMPVSMIWRSAKVR